MIAYGHGEPQGSYGSALFYVDLQTDTMYQFVNSEWVVYSVNGYFGEVYD